MDRFGESNTGRMLANTIMPESREMYLSSWSDVRLEYSRMSAYAGNDNFFSQRVYTDALSSDIRDMFSNGFKYGGAALLSKASRLLTMVDIVKATEDVYNAPPGQAGWVALKEYGAIYAATYGIGPGEAAGAEIGLFGGPVTEAIGAVTGGVVGASAGSSIWMTLVDAAHQGVDAGEEYIQQRWENRP